MSDHPTCEWEPRAPATLSDQRQAYDALRERCPVAHSEFLGWSLFRHQEIVDVVADPATYSSVSRHRAIPSGMDHYEHTRYRHLLEPYFGPEAMATFEPRCRQLAVDLTQTLLAHAEADFVTAFAQPFSIKAHCVFLGWPLETWQQLRDWTRNNQEIAFSRDREKAAALARELDDYVTAALRQRREAGAAAHADITTRLMGGKVGDAPLSDKDIVSILRNWIAGHGTVAAALGIVVSYLAEHPETQQRLRREPTLLPAAIEEILRTDGPLVDNRRTTTRNVTIAGQEIGAGERLTLIWIAANRDERAFDEPTAVRFDRDQEKNLLFGAGVHYCQGAPLARLELRVALEELLARTTAIEPGTTAPPQRDRYPSNGFETLPVRLR